PSGTTVYTLTASNAYGTTTATTSVALVPGSFVGPADIFLTMATSTPGTPLTIPILDDGTIGYPHWFQLESDGTTGVTSTPGLTVATSQHALPSSVEVGTTAYASTTATQSIALNDTYYYETAESYLPAGHPSATISGWLTVGPANAGVNGMTFDYAFIFGTTTGHFAGLQLRNGSPSYYVWIETGSPTLHSASIAVTPGGTYWFTLKADYAAGSARLAIFDTSGNQVGSTVSVAMPTGDTIGSMLIGNNEVGTSTSSTYFEDFMADFTHAAFPLGPTSRLAAAFSSMSAAPTASAATISWTTNASSSSMVSYGTTTSYGSTTAETDTSPRVTSHSVSLTGLSSCTTYHYEVGGVDGFLNQSSSTDQTFTTTGCAAPPAASSTPSVATASISSSGGSVSTAELASLLAPGPATDAYLASLKKRSFISGCPSGYICTPSSNSAAGAIVGSFVRDLSLGAVGSDVRALQIFLNRHGAPLASSGPGSPGHETDHFGPLTRAALIRFQDAHASSILAPLGLLHGTGYFGPSTLKEVDLLIQRSE
ncbi:MAG: peptidoglycan-binding protein, partial [Patescibacteria group bacterium]|nr:peptidoglycan-binding protein [Patescibacteria group bacterium]